MKKGESAYRSKRGIETMFRITANNHQRLSDMADNKASILITINSIILSVVITVLMRKVETGLVFPNAILVIMPTATLLLVNVSTITFAALSTRPSIPDANQLKKKRDMNYLFFGNFYTTPLKEYTEEMFAIMNDEELLYGSLIRDIHTQGVVLSRKYHLLRNAYNIFMFGIIISVLSFIVTIIIF